MKLQTSIHPLNCPDHIDPEVMKPYRISDFTFAYLLEGEILVDIDDKSYLIGPGQLMLVPENHTIIIRHYNGCKGYDGRFSVEFLKDASHPALLSNSPILQSFWFDDAVFMGALFHRMQTAYEDKDKAFLQSALDLILSQVRSNGRVAAIPEKFLQAVFDKESTPLQVADYAEQLNVTPNYLNKTVKQHTHRTAIDWVEIARLNRAKQLLKDPSVPISEIAGRVGIPDQSYFSRFFKKKTGQTPSQYRNTR